MLKDFAILIGAALIAGAPVVDAQSLHKCVARTGQVSYQSHPCDGDARTAWVREAAPEAPPPPERQAAMRREKARRDVGSDYLSQLARRRRGRPVGHAISTSRDATACEAARRRREAVLERAGLERTFDLLRRLDDEVARACR